MTNDLIMNPMEPAPLPPNDCSSINSISPSYSVQPSQPQILLILVGLPGSGKTTFSQALISHSEIAASSGKGRKWIRASQDDAPSRRRQECEYVVRKGLKDGCNVIVDRVDFDPVQRSHFLHIAFTHQPPPKIYCLTLTVSQSTLEKRLEYRPGHPTIPDLETGLRVLRQMGNQYRPPITNQPEGFDRIYELFEEDQPFDGIWTGEKIEEVLGKIECDGLKEVGERIVVPTNIPINGYGRGRSDYSSRGRNNDWSLGRGRGGYGYGGYSGSSSGSTSSGTSTWSNGYGSSQNGNLTWNQGTYSTPNRGRGYYRGGYSGINPQQPYQHQPSQANSNSNSGNWRQPY